MAEDGGLAAVFWVLRADSGLFHSKHDTFSLVIPGIPLFSQEGGHFSETPAGMSFSYLQ